MRERIGKEENRMKKNRKIMIGAAAAVVLAALILPRYLRKEEVMPTVTPVVETSRMEPATIQLYRGLTGSVEPADMIYLTPKLSGEVSAVYVQTGDVVTEGQILCQLDNKQVESARISMDTASISLEDAKTNLTRMQALYQSGDISAQSFEQIESNVKMAQLQYDAAKLAYDTQVEYSTITAPIGGLVESFNIEAHDMISQQTVICVISGEGSKAVSFSVTEQVAEHLQPGDEIRIEKNSSEYTGTITEISSMVDAATGLFAVKAAVDEADSLATGSMVKLYVLSDEAENTDTLPVDAVYYDGGEPYVYTYDEGTVHKVFVETGIYDSEHMQILSGIGQDDQVITTWSPELYEGAVVQLAQ